MRLPKIERLDLRPTGLLALRARLEWEEFEWMTGQSQRHPAGFSGLRTAWAVLDQGYFLPVQNYMLEYYSSYQ